MDRRDFIKISSAAFILPLLNNCVNSSSKEIPIEVRSNRTIGHQVFSELRSIPAKSKLKTEYLIVGGGIAGLAVASKLKNKDFYLLELDKNVGGTSGVESFNGISFAQGAHYDLSYPNFYGNKVLSFLKNLDIIDYDGLSNTWKFKEKKYLIDKSRESLCKAGGEFRFDVLPKGKGTQEFFKSLLKYEGEMLMPTRLIDSKYHYLNKLCFHEFLKKKVTLNPELSSAIDYQLIDDFGAGSKTVSALAGIHYYMCRPYHKEEMELFSPPQGNYYFAEKMLATISLERIKTNHLVYHINERKKGFEVLSLDLKSNAKQEIECNKIIYAGKKHALKHIFPKYHKLFKQNIYAPWVVVNLVTKNFYSNGYYWQNELIKEESDNFMGFVDSKSQAYEQSDFRIFTAYFCYPHRTRKQLIEIENNPKILVNKVIKNINTFLKENLEDKVVKAYVKIMGHAMPIPNVNYLFPKQLPSLEKEGIAFAGVDVGRLPLLFEALDSGVGTLIPEW